SSPTSCFFFSAKYCSVAKHGAWQRKSRPEVGFSTSTASLSAWRGPDLIVRLLQQRRQPLLFQQSIQMLPAMESDLQLALVLGTDLQGHLGTQVVRQHLFKALYVAIAVRLALGLLAGRLVILV